MTRAGGAKRTWRAWASVPSTSVHIPLMMASSGPVGATLTLLPLLRPRRDWTSAFQHLTCQNTRPPEPVSCRLLSTTRSSLNAVETGVADAVTRQLELRSSAA
jgi:hypothetical protein